MKVSRESSSTGFKPVTITITIESEDELRNMFFRHNMALSDPYKKMVDNPDNDDPLFALIQEIVGERGIIV